jgi:phosphate-selective porin
MTRMLAGILLVFCVSASAAAQELTVRGGKWLRVDFHARIQSDVRRSGTQTGDEVEPALDVARRRVGIEGRVGQIVDYQFEYEIGSREWRDVYVDYRQFKAVQAQAGAFKIPFGLEEITSATRLDFVYRSRISARLAPGRDRGVMAHGKLLKNRIAYQAGVFQHDGDNALPKKATRSGGGRTMAARLVVEPFRASKTAIANLHVGAAVSMASIPLGLPSVRARTVFGSSFFDSDVWVRGRRQRTGLEAAWRPGPFSVRAEFIRLTDERREQAVDGGDLSPLVAQGWYVSGTYRLARLEAATRIERLSFGNTSGHPDASSSRRAEVILGNFDRVVTFGVNWYVNRWVKLQANLIREQLHDASFWSRVLRLQVAI